MTGLLVTGTDTGVGKTVVACAIATEARRQGLRVVVWKPVETGWGISAEAATDAARLRHAAGSTEPLDVICPYRFRSPVAPVVAARLEGTEIDPVWLAGLYRTRASSSDLVIVEGAGGLLVPLTGTTTYAELARDLGLTVLIVAANRLGVVNHSALTARAAAAEHLRVLGFVLNEPGHTRVGSVDTNTADDPSRNSVPEPVSATDPSTATNRATITELTGLQCLGEIPYMPDVFHAPERVVPHLNVSEILAAR